MKRHCPHATLDWYLCPDYVPWTCPPGHEERKKGADAPRGKKKADPLGPRATDHICVHYLCVAHIRYASATRTYTHREVHKKKRPGPQHHREKKNVRSGLWRSL